MSEEKAEYQTLQSGKEVKVREAKKAASKPTKNYKGLVMMDFKIENESYKLGDDYTTKDEALFNKLIRLQKINKK